MLGPRHGHERILIVEGIDDRHSVVGLMRAHVDWPQQSEKWPVYIDLGSSASQILDRAYLRTRLKEPGVTTVGIMLDADGKAKERYQSIRNTCMAFFPNLPEELPPNGLVAWNAGGMRMGVWIMPDNVSDGYLETFLRFLVPSAKEPIWQLAVKAVDQALAIGAECPTKDSSKAQLYTWLAWQDPPGQQPGLALTKRILDPQSSYAAPFVRWFRELYEL